MKFRHMLLIKQSIGCEALDSRGGDLAVSGIARYQCYARKGSYALKEGLLVLSSA